MAIPDQPPFKIFLGNLPFDAVQGDIETILGTLEIPQDEIRRFNIRMIRDRETDKFKGFAYIELNSKEQVQKALTLKGVKFGGRGLKVDVAAPKKLDSDRGRGGRGGIGRGRGGRSDFSSHGNSDFRGGRDGGYRSGYRDDRGERTEHLVSADPSHDSHASHSEENHEMRVTERPRLRLTPRTTDPAVLEEKIRIEAEEERKRRAKLFGNA